MRVKVASEGWLGSVELLGFGGSRAADNVVLDLAIGSASPFGCFVGFLVLCLGRLDGFLSCGALERCGVRSLPSDLNRRMNKGRVFWKLDPM